MSSMEEISKYLSYILRHKPDSIGLELDNQGWANINEIIQKTKDFELNREIIDIVVKHSDKQRFEIEGSKIRANQGHSIDVDLGLKVQKPPKKLYHGTATRFLDNILRDGLLPQKRQYVHLTQKIDIAKEVGCRYGKAVILEIDSECMSQDGYIFYVSKNCVWLTKKVPSKYIKREIE